MEQASQKQIETIATLAGAVRRDANRIVVQHTTLTGHFVNRRCICWRVGQLLNIDHADTQTIRVRLLGLILVKDFFARIVTLEKLLYTPGRISWFGRQFLLIVCLLVINQLVRLVLIQWIEISGSIITVWPIGLHIAFVRRYGR
jgi:hypothetical protein